MVTEHSITTTQIHPDGYIFAFATENGHVEFWDMRVRNFIKRFEDQQSAISAIAFAPNGYQAAFAIRDTAELKIINLRNYVVKKVIKPETGNLIMNDAIYDNTGHFLATAGTSVR